MPAHRGHRLLPHTADVIVEAWGPDRAACFAEAVRGLVSIFADVTGVAATGEAPCAVRGGDDVSLLVGLLDEVIYLVDARGVVPVDVVVEPNTGGGLAGTFATAPAAAVEPSGAVPKAVSWHGAEVAQNGEGWRCRVTVDV